MVSISSKVGRALSALILAFLPLFWVTPASANQLSLQDAQAALELAQQEVIDATVAKQLADEAVISASAEVDRTLAERNATAVTVSGTTTTTTQNVVQNGTFASTANWTSVVASDTRYTGGANPIIYNGKLKGSYTAGYYIQQTGTFPSPTRQVTFAVDVWNYDTNDGNRIANPDYYRIEFRTYAADGTRLNYYNLEWSQWHDQWITRGATYTLAQDAVRWDIGFRMADGGYWAGAFGPEMDNVQLLATMVTSTPDTVTYDSDKQAAYDAAISQYNQALSVQASANTRLSTANSEVVRLTQLVADLTPHLNAPSNLVAVIDSDSVDLSWTAPASNASGVTVERYAIMWSTTNFTQNGWGWAHDQTSVSIPLSILNSAGGLGNIFQFQIRADNDTERIYSPYSNVVSVQTVEPQWWQIEFVEGQQVNISAPEGYKFGYPRAWYGSPTDPTCGASVSGIVNELINGRSSASFIADNAIFGDPCGGVVKVLRMSTPVDAIVIPTPTPTPEPTPTPTPQPEPTQTIQPSPEPEPTPIVTPTPEPELTPEPTPEPTEEPTPEPTPSPEPTAEPEPIPSQESKPEISPEPKPSPSPEQTVKPEPIVPEEKVEIKEEISAENIESLVEELTDIQPQLLTEEQQELIVEAAIEVFASAEQGSPEYQAALDALLVVAQADDIVLDEALAAVPLIGDVAGAAVEVFNALGNAGADMSPQVREQSEKVVIAAVIVGQVAMTATAAATSAAAAAARRP